MILDPRSAPAAEQDAEQGEVVNRATLAIVADYARLTGARAEQPAPNLIRLTVAAGEERHFGGRREHLLALDIAAVERYPESELPVIGGSFWAGLIEAIRSGGQRLVGGLLPTTVTAGAELPDVPVVDASVELAGRSEEVRRVVRLAARVGVAAGTALHEEIVESPAVDLSTGQPVPPAVASRMSTPETGTIRDGAFHSLPAAADRLVPTVIAGLEEQISARLAAVSEQAARELTQELARIDRYYGALEDEVRDEAGSASAALRTIEHEHAKRRAEEVRRHDVRVEVHPIQVVERTVLVERATWRLTTHTGRTAELNAHRYLSGDAGWGIHCQDCGRVPRQLCVCREGHPVGTECAQTCGVCDEPFCHRHGSAGCSVDGAATCREHARTCFSCERSYCTSHEATCDEGSHHACVTCMVACAVCARAICRKHATTTDEDAPRGARLLCTNCLVHCEGATSEPIGRDEAEPCGTCSRYICERHQVRCVVDDKPHCSKHLRRADRSRRFVCEPHIAACEFEPGHAFVPDEVQPCMDCGRVSCIEHGARCLGDEAWHCLDHLRSVADVPGRAACSRHRAECHIDGQTFSVAGVAGCVVCGSTTCRTHLQACTWCGAEACTNDMQVGRCVTCGWLAPAVDPPDEVITAAAGLTGERKAKKWWIARDGSRFVVQLDLGWTRRLVFSVPHGSASAAGVMRHSLLGSSTDKS